MTVIEVDKTTAVKLVSMYYKLGELIENLQDAKDDAIIVEDVIMEDLEEMIKTAYEMMASVSYPLHSASAITSWEFMDDESESDTEDTEDDDLDFDDNLNHDDNLDYDDEYDSEHEMDYSVDESSIPSEDASDGFEDFTYDEDTFGVQMESKAI